MFNVSEPVRVVTKNNQLIKEGIVVSVTNNGACVYQPKSEHPFVDSSESAEWFPFQSRELRMIGGSQAKRR